MHSSPSSPSSSPSSKSWVGALFFAAFGLGGLSGAVAFSFASRPALTTASIDPGVARSLTALAADVDFVKLRVETLERRPALAERAESFSGRRDTEAVAPPEPSTPTEPAAGPAAGKDGVVAAAAKLLEPKFEALMRAGVPDADLKKLFDDIVAAGGQDAAIAALEALIARDPANPKSHYLLAKACCARLMVESTPAGYQKWGDRAMGAWQKASDLDADYWQPRFERAEYLTYYPESEGKTPEVIAQFEQLLTLQGGTNTNPRFARTYAHLSRMYLRVGQKEKALATLRAGVSLFPDDAELGKQLQLLRGG